LDRLASKEITKDALLQEVERNFDLLPEVFMGVSSAKPAVRYGCGKALMDLSEKYPEKLYLYMDSIIDVLNSEHRILVWNALTIIANLTTVDEKKKFDAIFDKYYSFLSDAYMVTVANGVCNSAKIAMTKPYLIQKITSKLLTVGDISTTPHLTEECKRVIIEKTIIAFGAFFEKIYDKKDVISFVEPHLSSPRRNLRIEAESLLKKWNN